MKHVLVAVCLIVGAHFDLQSPQGNPELRLWYRQPAATWNEALPIGNGRLGAMVFGGVEEERLQLNEDTVWAGEKRDRLNPAGPEAVKEVRRLLMSLVTENP